MNEGSKALSEFIFQSKYSRYNPKLGRKETFEESVDRISDMHLRHLQEEYPNVLNNAEFNNDYLEAIEAYKRGEVYGSQRALQFGGDPILKKNARLFNCAFTYCDRLDVFKEIEWVLLCGCGSGVSVEYQHVNKLPQMPKELSAEVVNYQIDDSIEGWSNAIQTLINYYFDNNNPYPKFDYSLIRPAGSLIAGGFIAPGPNGLRNSIKSIEELLNKVHKTPSRKLTPLNCADIIGYCADSVLSGGVRRSAVIILFSPEDDEMYNAKTGNWFYENPQRGRFNASAVLERGETKKDIFDNLFNATKQFGEPGFYWRSNKGLGCNPCQPKWATVITPSGLSTIEDIKEGDKIWSSEGWTTVVNKWSTGIKPVYKYKSTGGIFYGTENHKLLQRGKKVEAKDCIEIDSLSGENYIRDEEFDIQYIMDGLVLGDGFVHKASNNLIVLCIGKKDIDYFNSEIKDLIIKHRPGVSDYAYEIKTNIKSEELKYKPEIEIPERYFKASKLQICSLLRGLYTANGSVISNRITYKTASPKLRDQIQLLLSYLGIDSYYTTNQKHDVTFANGTYECKESYDINISSDRDKFVSLIGFIQKYKNDKITIKPKKDKLITRPIKIKELIGEEEVFDITVDNKSHTYWTGGVNVSNCGEIGFVPSLNGQTGWQFCNLSFISGIKINSAEDFYSACKHAATLGTIQASYQKFPFLGKVTEELVKSDPLIGVSISGIMTNPDILLDPEVLNKGAKIVKDQNLKISKFLNINPSSRTCTVKPDGNASVLTGNTPGCHGEHARRYIRRVQVNKDEEAGQIYKKYNPKSVVESVWSNNHTDDCIMFAIEANEQAVLKSELLGTKQLDVVKLLYNNWIIPGSRDESSTIQNNVSNTVIVPDDEWEDVKQYIWDNQNFIAGVSFIPQSGDTEFNQPPYTEVLLPNELIELYGDGVIFASGLIVDAEKVFGDLWKACDTFNGLGEKLYATDKDIREFITELNVSRDPKLLTKPHSEWIEASKKEYDNWVRVLSELNYSDEFIDDILDSGIEIPESEIKKYLDKTAFKNVVNLTQKRDIMRRMKKYGDKYFYSDYKLMITALKQVQLYHDWCDITMNYTPVNWEEVKWKNVYLNADEMAGASCSGGGCEVTKL